VLVLEVHDEIGTEVKLEKSFFVFLLRSVLLEETNITQAPGQDTRWAPHSAAERVQPPRNCFFAKVSIRQK
jgi:hypothetical protein